MLSPSDFLEPGETLGTTINFGDDENNPTFLLHPVLRAGRADDDRVLLEIRSNSEPLVLVGGNPLHIETLHGLGSVATVDLATGEKTVEELQPGTTIDIQPGGIHWYENLSELLVRDTSLDFQLANEVRLGDFVQAIADTIGRR